ncbi:MAG TPA: MFS transporter [Jatrophihabitans sp.]
MTATATSKLDEQSAPSIFSGALRTTTVGLIILISMIAFEAMAVTPALPSAARDLHGLSAFGWAFTAFLIANIVGMVAAGQLSDIRGPRPGLLAGMVLFIAGLVIAGTSTTMAQLIASRAVQGIGGGLLITSTYVLIGVSYPEEVRPKVFVATSGAWLLPSLLGPLVSGLITQHINWRWVFLGLLPFVIIGAALMVPVLGRLDSHDTSKEGLSDPRRLLLALVVAAGIAVFEGAGQHPSTATVALAVAGVAAAVWGVRGLVPPGTFRACPGVSAPIALRALIAGAFFGTESVIPLMLSQQHGLDPTAAGLPLAVSGLAWGAGSWWQSREIPGETPKAEETRRVWLLRAGFASLSVAIVAIAVTSIPASPAWLAYPGWAFAGLGAGLALTTSSVLLLRHTNDADRGRDSAALQLGDTTFSSFTAGSAGVLVAAAAVGSIGYTKAFLTLDALMLVIAFAGIAVSGRARTLPA